MYIKHKIGLLVFVLFFDLFSRTTATDDVVEYCRRREQPESFTRFPAFKNILLKAYTLTCYLAIKFGGARMETPKPKENPSLFIALRKSIVSVNTSDLSSETIVTGDGVDKYFVMVDYDPVDEYLYWTTNAGIEKSKVGGSVRPEKLFSGRKYDGIAVDWIARNMYWTDADLNQISVARLDGRHQKALIKENIDLPRGIAVNPKDGELFWTEWGGFPRIGKASLDGSDVQSLVTKDVGWPNGVALDIDQRLVYFADAKTDKIEVVGMDGRGRKVILKEEPGHKFGLSFLDGYLYWTDWRLERAEQMRVDDTSERDVLFVSAARMFGIKATFLEPPSFTNPCAENNGGCSHLCFHTPGGLKCGCSDEATGASSSMSCEP